MLRTLSVLIVLTLHIAAYGQQLSQFNSLRSLQQYRAEITRKKNDRIQTFIRNNRSTLSSYKLSKDFLLVDISNSGIPVFRSALNAGASVTTGAARLQSGLIGLDLQGENMTVGIWDDGLVKNHVELGSRILTKEGPGETLHIIHVTGTILATGINALAKGMAPKAKATTWYFDNDEPEMAALARPDQTSLLFSNHSYGTVTGWTVSGGAWVWTGDSNISEDEDYRFGFYDERAQTLDQLTYLAPYYTIVWAAGNDRTEVGDGTHPPDCNGGAGYDCIIPDALGKNVITVGAVNKVPSYTSASSVVMSTFSSWGPTDDGRIKPDLVGAGVNLFSLSNAGTNQYTTLSGTSMATPNVTGSLLLVQELYSKLHGGKFMRSSTLKGLAIHTAKEAGIASGPDYSFGWGLLDVEAAAKTLMQEDNQSVLLEELSLANGKTYTQDIFSKANQKITVTICWTDPAGTPAKVSLDPTNLMLVNDLDVRIADASGKIQLPWTLDPFSPASKATPGDNFRDNVEKIEFNNPEAKKYTITVNHKGTLTNGKQDFALIITHQSSLSSGLTYYWIGNDGNWNDGAHWSLTSGGASANAVPGINDNVIFDENSIDGIASSVINFSADAACNRLIWLTDKPAAFAMNAHRLKMQNDFSMSAKNFRIASKGTLEFNGVSEHTVNIHNGNLLNAALEFTGGNWTITGDLDVDKIHLNQGGLTMSGLVCSTKELNALDNTTLSIAGSTIDSVAVSSITSGVSLVSDSTVIRVMSPAQFSWNNMNYLGEIDIQNNSSLQLNNTGTIATLHALAGSSMKMADGTTQTFSNMLLDGTAGNSVTLQSTGKATVNLTAHQKMCFDNLKITNVDVTGNAVVNAGLASTLTNSNNWLHENCQDVLFADFDVQYNCQNALTEFTSNNSGKATAWSWNFGDNGSTGNDATTQNAKHQFSGQNMYVVTLTVSDGTVSTSYSKNIQILQNNLAENSIVLSGSSLFSFRESGSYQWYKNGVAISNATSRSYDYAGTVGSYTVVTAGDAVCNSVSQPFVVTGVELLDNSLEIFPNPAHDFVSVKIISGKAAGKITMYDLMGQPVYSKTDMGSETTIDVRNFEEGMYILEVYFSSAVYKRKILVNR